MKEIIIGITGASGAVYARRLLGLISDRIPKIHLIVSDLGAKVCAAELDISAAPDEITPEHLIGRPSSSIEMHHFRNQAASVASGSCTAEAMVIVPCSMRTLGCIANGCGNTLIHRAADVILKEQRPLVLVPRETPLSQIHLENMLKLSRAGACVLPAMPAFYHNPKNIDGLVDYIVAKILNRLGIEQDLVEPWS